MHPLGGAVFVALLHYRALGSGAPEAIKENNDDQKKKETWPFRFFHPFPGSFPHPSPVSSPFDQNLKQKSVGKVEKSAGKIRKSESGKIEKTADASSASSDLHSKRSKLEADLSVAAGTHANAFIEQGTARKISEIAEGKVAEATEQTKKAETSFGIAMENVEASDEASYEAKEQENTRNQKEVEAHKPFGGLFQKGESIMSAQSAKTSAAAKHTVAESKMEAALNAALESAESQKTASNILKDSLRNIVSEAKAAERVALATQKNEAKKVAKITLNTATKLASDAAPTEARLTARSSRHAQLNEQKSPLEVSTAVDKAIAEQVEALQAIASKAAADREKLQRLRAASRTLERNREEAQHELQLLLGEEPRQQHNTSEGSYENFVSQSPLT